MPDLSETGTLAAALAVALAAVEAAKLALGRLGRNGHGEQDRLAEIERCQEATSENLAKVSHSQERILERLDREVIPAVAATKHTVANVQQGLQTIGGDVRELEGVVGRLAGQVGSLARGRGGDGT